MSRREDSRRELRILLVEAIFGLFAFGAAYLCMIFGWGTYAFWGVMAVFAYEVLKAIYFAFRKDDL